ncbi:hypothetical protein JOM56_000875 [Amanita muscaria]
MRIQSMILLEEHRFTHSPGMGQHTDLELDRGQSLHRQRISVACWELACIYRYIRSRSYPGRNLATLALTPDRLLVLHDLSFRSHMPRLDLILPRLPKQSVAGLESLCQAVVDSIHVGSEEETVIDLNDIRYPKLAFAHIWGPYKISGFHSPSRIFNGADLPMTVIECLDFLRRSGL